ncbi:unnamed protein product [Adineta steineri]|uniref:PDZ domain-containing protein n=1 Tax=Adineta steineri TaxID=433720 RepID=A0A818HNM4_9BILA|nr:unnamed protein product [Adineta steineri]CAF3506269.1 unnamed protein product [Adineta steineri]
MSTPDPRAKMRTVKFRLCKIRKWPDYTGLGFSLLGNSQEPPFLVGLVESNSPAAAGGLRISDVIIEVNKKDMTKAKAKYADLTGAIQKARDSKGTIDLLVVEKRWYDQLIKEKTKFDPKLATTIETPPTMPPDYKSFPQNTPRTCEIRLAKDNEPLGFEVVNGDGDIGMFIQDVNQNSVASREGLRKSDRIIEVNDEFVDDQPSKDIMEQMKVAKSNLYVKLYVLDTKTYKNFKQNNTPLASSHQPASDSSSKHIRPVQTTKLDDYDDDDDDDDNDGNAADRYRPTAPTPSVNGRRSPTRSEVPSTPVGLAALAKHNPIQAAANSIPNSRLYQVRRTPGESFGFSVNSKQPGPYPHMITNIARGSPAEKYGLREDDYILTVNNRDVSKVGAADFNPFLRSAFEESDARNQPLSIEVINKDAMTPVPPYETSYVPKPPSTITRQSSKASTIVNETYPEMRLCQIKSGPQSQEIGFDINQLPGKRGRNGGFQIQNLKPNSPAALTKIHNNDYIIEVNGENIENDDYESVRDNITDSYDSNRQIELLVIDHDGYQWYKTRNYPIDPSSRKANCVRYTTPSSPSRPITRPSPPPSLQPSPPPSRRPSPPSSIRPSRRPSPPPSPTPSKATVISELVKHTPTKTLSPGDKSNLSATNNQMNNQSSINANQQSSYNKHGSAGIHQLPNSSPLIDGSSPLVDGSSKYLSLSRGAVDVVSEKRVFRFCRLHIKPGQRCGFLLESGNNKHVVRKVEHGSPADKAGLHVNDCLLEVNNANVENKSSEEVDNLIQNVSRNGVVCLLVVPNDVKPLRIRSSKSVSALHDSRHYQDTTTSNETLNDIKEYPSSFKRSQSASRLHGEHINRDPSFQPTDPLPRKCVLTRDSSFRGCGFRLSNEQNLDTPIVVEVLPNSPAKRSGLSEGDHILYIDTQNIQTFISFDDKIQAIQRAFQRNGQVELVTLTGPGYQILKQRGGYLESSVFDYHLSNTSHMKPRLCKLNLYNYEHDFGLKLHRENFLLTVKSVQKGLAADIFDINEGDIVLELNDQDTKYLSTTQVEQIIENSKHERTLKILVIDIDGYRYSAKHAIPINSHLSFVQTQDERNITKNKRSHGEPVYL